MLAYYILCDYYKNDSKQLENTFLSLNKVRTQYHYFDPKVDKLVLKICASCKYALSKYGDHSIQRHSKKTLIDTIATFTLGAMYQYSDDIPTLAMARVLLKTAQDIFCNDLKLTSYKKITHHLIAITHYNHFVFISDKEDKAPALEQLRKSAQLEYMPAIHKMAELYIQQYTTGKIIFSINKDDFFPLLKQDAQSNSESLDLFEKCIRSEAKHTQQSPAKKIKSHHNEPEQDDPVTVVQDMEKKGLSMNADTVLQHMFQNQPEQSADILPKSFNAKNSKEKSLDTKEESSDTKDKPLSNKEMMRNKRAQLQRKTKK